VDVDSFGVDSYVLRNDCCYFFAHFLQLGTIEPGSIVGQHEVQATLGYFFAGSAPFKQPHNVIPYLLHLNHFLGAGA